MSDLCESGSSEWRELALLENSGELVMVLEADGTITFVGPTQERILGFTRTYFQDLAFRDLVHSTEVEAADEFLTDILSSPLTPVTGRIFRILNFNGVSRTVQVTGSNRLGSPPIFGLVLHIRDITEEALLREQVLRLRKDLVERAEHDPLTGLLTHRVFQRRLEDELRRASLLREAVTIVLIDLKNFAFINDAHGHSVGDQLLKRLSRELLPELEFGRFGLSVDDVTIARYGGDEFSLILPRVGLQGAADVPWLIQEAIARFGYEPANAHNRIPLACSVGTAVYPLDGANRAQLLTSANERLRRSKTEQPENTEVERVRRRLRAASEGFTVLDALLTATDNKDRYTRRHSEDVMGYSLQIAAEVGFPGADLNTLEEAALLHDIGKIGVPDSILRKPGRLTETEFDAMKQHPTTGAMMAGAIPYFQRTLDGIHFHHERWDGLGYPLGLQAQSIPLMARIISVADSYSAMTTDRPYRVGMNPSNALAILKHGSGTQWDPDCIAGFLRAQRIRGNVPRDV